MGFHSRLLRVVLAVTMIGKTVSSTTSVRPSPTWIRYNTFTRPLDMNTVQTATLRNLVPWSSFIQSSHMGTKAPNSPSIMSQITSDLVPSSRIFIQSSIHRATQAPKSPSIMAQITSTSTRRTSVLQQIPPTITSTISEVITSRVLLPTIHTSVTSKHDHFTPSPTTRSIQATTSVILIPPEVTCEENHMQIVLDKNTYPNLNSSSFHLRDSSCVGQVTGSTIKLMTSLNSCNTTSKQTDDTITYKNEVRAERTIKTYTNGTITRHEALVLPFNCTYKRRKYVGVTSFEPKRRVDAKEGSFGNFTFLMDLYSDNSYNSSYNTSDYPISVALNQRLYIKYRVLSDKADLYVFADKCLATTTTSESTIPNYVFIDKGCALDQTIVYNYKANREQTLSIQAFRFIADHPVVYLHCLLLVCHSSYNSSKCAVGCSNNRVRRDMSRNDQESNLYHLSSGAITLKKTTTKGTPDSSTTPGLTVIALSSTVAVLVIGCFVLLVLLRRKKKQSNKTECVPEPTQLEVYDNQGVNRDDPVSLGTTSQQD